MKENTEICPYHNVGVAHLANIRKDKCAFQRHHKFIKPDELILFLISTIGN